MKLDWTKSLTKSAYNMWLHDLFLVDFCSKEKARIGGEEVNAAEVSVHFKRRFDTLRQEYQTIKKLGSKEATRIHTARKRQQKRRHKASDPSPYRAWM